MFTFFFLSLAFGDGETYPYDPEHGTGSNSTDSNENIDIGNNSCKKGYNSIQYFYKSSTKTQLILSWDSIGAKPGRNRH